MTTNKHPIIAMSPVKSSQITHIGHDDKTNTLAVTFKGGSTYHYPDFDTKAFTAFKGAESLGKHFGAHIQKRKFVKLPQVKK